MDCRSVLLFCLAVFLAVLLSSTEGRTKKVVIHVPYKVKKIKHVHTVFKTVHHHHRHHDHSDLDTLLPAEEHEHFHYMHIDEPLTPLTPAVKQPHLIPGAGVQGISIPGFLPDAPLDESLDTEDLLRDGSVKPKRLSIPLYRRVSN